jgi:hypothetical protein
MKYFAVLFLISGLTACTVQQPITTQVSQNNQDYKVAYLFEHDGCKVYRFYDGGMSVYFTNCNGSVTAASSDSTNTQNIIRVKEMKGE